MPHKVNSDSIHENIFLLINVCLAAEKFAKTYDLDYENEADTINGTYYYSFLQAIVSEKLIDTAIKARILFDIVLDWQKDQDKHDPDSFDLRQIDLKFTEQRNIGYFIGIDDTISLREACNKIIHAIEIDYKLVIGDDHHDLDEEREEKREWKYWDGVVEFKGQKGSRPWSFCLHVNEFCDTMSEMLSFLDLNVDWYRIHKYDWPY